MPQRKNQVNKSQAIRELLEQSPDAKAKEIVAKLAQKQIVVKPSLVYMIKGRLTQINWRKKKRAARAASASQKTGSTDPIGLIIKVKQLAREAGGIGNLKTLVSVLAD
jgi:hypothetical protein